MEIYVVYCIADIWECSELVKGFYLIEEAQEFVAEAERFCEGSTNTKATHYELTKMGIHCSTCYGIPSFMITALEVV